MEDNIPVGEILDSVDNSDEVIEQIKATAVAELGIVTRMAEDETEVHCPVVKVTEFGQSKEGLVEALSYIFNVVKYSHEGDIILHFNGGFVDREYCEKLLHCVIAPMLQVAIDEGLN